MREIKFRGKCIDSDEWVYGDLLTYRILPVIFNPKTRKQYEVAGNTVGQFTGLLDKNGKEIYEGDILSPEWNVVRVVRFGSVEIEDNEMYGSNDVVGFYLDKRGRFYHMDNQDDFEVIGNIHENPELLKDSQQ